MVTLFLKSNYMKIVYASIIWALTLFISYLLLRTFSADSFIGITDDPKNLQKNISHLLASIASALFLLYILGDNERRQLRESISFKNKSLIPLLLPAVLTSTLFFLCIPLLKINLSEFGAQGNPGLFSSLWNNDDFIAKLLFGFVFIKIFIFIPIIQEFVFRFYMIETFRRNANSLLAALLSSFLFALSRSVMGGLFAMFWSLLLGLLLCVFYLRSGSLMPSIYLNIMFHFAAYTAIFFSNTE